MSFDDLVRDMDADVLDAFGSTLRIIKPDGASLEFVGIIDESVESFTPDGVYQGKETHLSADQAVGLQAKWNIKHGDKKYRIVKPLESDGFMSRYLLAPLSKYDFEEIVPVADVLDGIVNESW